MAITTRISTGSTVQATSRTVWWLSRLATGCRLALNFHIT